MKQKHLLDSGSLTNSFIKKSFVRQIKQKISHSIGEVYMANSSLSTKIEGECIENFKLQDQNYSNVNLLVIDNLCSFFSPIFFCAQHFVIKVFLLNATCAENCYCQTFSMVLSVVDCSSLPSLLSHPLILFLLYCTIL